MRLFNNVKRNYTTIEREAFTMVYALHKFCHYFLGNKFIFYVDHMALLYLVQKPQVLGRITRWLLIFLEYVFLVIYKLGRSHYVADALFWMHELIEDNGVPNQTTNISFFLLQLVWLQEFLITPLPKKIWFSMFKTKRKKLALRALHFYLIHGKVYCQGQDQIFKCSF